ncbi:MAG: transposase [Deltaproteobacteria bacterium]|nr:transposase [Deltaproteobacteria bacterium]
MERGFARVVCPSCQYEILVPFSCKVRGLCPSCDGRRMAAGAADLVDHILPVVADYRQWTLSFPRWLRIRLLRDKALVSQVLLVFVRVVAGFHRRRARHRGIAGGQTGAVTAIQRVGSFANANLHFHTLVPEGVWHERPDGSLGFHPLPPPTDEDVEKITARIVDKIRRLLARRDGDAVDDEPDALADAQAEAVQLPMSLAEPPPRTSASRRRCAFIDGFSLHADTSVDAADRPALERLVRYVLRPLISADRLTARPDGRVEYHFRRPDPSGRTSWVTDGSTWCRRLATLIPPRRSHTTRFHGVLSSAHGWRSRVVPSPTAAQPASTSTSTSTSTPPTSSAMLARRLDWAALLRRVFGDEVTQCPRCGDALRVLAFITDPRVTAHILEHLGLICDAVPISPARAPPDDPISEFEFGP